MIHHTSSRSSSSINTFKMRNTLLIASAFSGLAAALPQMINVHAAEAVPTPAVLGPKPEDKPNAAKTYNPVAATKAAAALVENAGVIVNKRGVNDACSTQPGGAGPVPGDGSVDAYLDTTNALRKAARDAATPSGYTKSFTDLTGATEQVGYLTYKNIDSGAYDVAACAAFCDSEKFCLGFNIFAERDPSLNADTGCSNPVPITNIKCSLFGYPVSANSATNQGQYRADFHVVVTASNGYSKLDGTTCKPAPTVSDFNAPTNLPAAINAPFITKNNAQYDTYNGMRLFNTNPYDPSLCAAACEAQTDFDKNHLADANGAYKPCNFFTSYILTKNGVPLGTYCAFYTQAWGSDLATNTGYFDGDDTYSVICAASYTATTTDSGVLAQGGSSAPAPEGK
ncbi:Galactose oxidase [Pyrenophora seminiperda CCB06]|uniref:Galactose oxidase n=1 Tax=Pyrenophora seminiperda CCB06 TaxID=1302712 RepID=A0A3M7MGN8_9PLEO|nr:Galactose oxidase [Pyrenophora seminiperda CCB06]